MAEKKVIAVLGATGSQGGGLCNAILEDASGGFACRAITRDPNKDQAKALADRGAEVVAADIDDVDSLTKALQGAYGLYAVTNFWEHFSGDKEKEQAKNIAEAAKAAGVRHVVWSTLEDTRDLMDAGDKRMPFLQDKYRVPHFDAKAEANEFFKGLPTTYLVTSFYWDNMYMFGLAPKKNDDGTYTWTVPMGTAKLAAISARDIGRIAYGVFKGGEAYIGQTVGVAGGTLTLEEMSRTLEQVLNVNVSYNAVEPDDYRGFGFPGADELGNMFQVYRDFEKQVLGARSVEVARKLNPELESFEDFVKRQRDAIVGAMNS